jgi:hypothetical protein
LKTIVWDVDDVLNDLTRSWFEDWSRGSGSISRPYGSLTRNPPHELLGISRGQYLASLDDFRLCGKAANLPPLPEIYDWFCRHGEKCCNIALTAAPLCAAQVSAQWVMNHFGRWIRSFNIVPSYRPGDPAGKTLATKSEFLRWWGKCDLLIDDSEENIAGARGLALRTVLFPRPWNSSNLSPAETLRIITRFVDEA